MELDADFQKIPDDWSVLIFDVRGSTQAIEEGRYRQVNMVGAMCLAAAFNFFGRNDFPFVFGGDGATLLLPTMDIERFVPTILATMARSEREFNLKLRVGYVAISELRRSGTDVLLRRKSIAKSFIRTDFLGGGLDLAEKMIKSEKAPARLVTMNGPQGDEGLSVEGLECRWQPVKPRQGKFYSVIVRSRRRSPKEATLLYRAILELITQREAATSDQFKISLNPTKLSAEVRSHSKASDNSVKRLLKYFILWIYSLFGRFSMAAGIVFKGIDWGLYRKDLIANTDFIKIDDALRFVIDLSDQEAGRLFGLLDALEADGLIDYAAHTSPEAQLTCFVGSLTSDHIHFIDGTNGGYAAAAKTLKKKIASSNA